ncbi:MAG: methyltransferase domain-containing protein [Flavobacteriaceae bacterium]|nr:methyltransferase domain-containing protein [Flavobacteriaceae bacterium]
MDDMNFQGPEMHALLEDLARVNSWLGGIEITVTGIQKLLQQKRKAGEQLTIVDVGCGDGEILRQCSQWAAKQGISVHCIGVDANPFILNIAEQRSSSFSNIEFKKIDVLSNIDSMPEFDIALCTLFLHHFDEGNIVRLLGDLQSKAKVGIVINDLQRSAWAFGLFKIFSSLFLKTRTARHDGLVSVARGFKKKELQQLSQGIQGVHEIHWKWAFRYQWLISNL